jgi:hypothetical protein
MRPRSLRLDRLAGVCLQRFAAIRRFVPAISRRVGTSRAALSTRWRRLPVMGHFGGRCSPSAGCSVAIPLVVGVSTPCRGRRAC